MSNSIDVHVRNEVAIIKSARILQISSMFDVPPHDRSINEWDVSLPLGERSWNIGAIIGPSGAGKTSVAKALFPDKLIREFEWPTDRSVLDAFPAALGVKDVAGALTAVGFGSPPSWFRPYYALSTGEQFRVTCARALAESSDLVVIDEFTSVVDRQVAKVASHAVQKAARKAKRQLVAVSCHYDIIDWLQPDWVYQPHTNQFAWRSLQQHPPLELKVYPCTSKLWPIFRRHHYLSAALNPSAVCFGGWIDDELVAFTSYLHLPHWRVRNIKLGHRLVVLPDYQGLGIGGRLDDWLGQYLYERNFKYHNVVAHPAMIAYYRGSPRWKQIRTPGGRGALADGYQHYQLATSSTADPQLAKRHHQTRNLNTYSFQYVPPKEEASASEIENSRSVA